jgi:VWFA-related protein
MRAPHVSIVAAVVCALVTVSAQAPTPTAPAPQATFRAGVDVVTFDVTVLDKDRKPVRGLTAADFTVIEDGKPRPIVAFTSVDVPGPEPVSAPWMRDVASDVVSNATGTRRLVMIVMDDAWAYPAFGGATTAKDIARRVIDALGPDDVASVAFTFRGRSQNFTSDPRLLRAAVDSFTPKLFVPDEKVTGLRPAPPAACEINLEGCTVSLLRKVGDALANAPAGRKTVIYISPAGLPDLGRLDVLPYVTEMLRSLQRANITVYSFDPYGLTSPSRYLALIPHDTSGLRWLAENTGGRAVVSTNEPEAHVAEVLDESSHYYLLGFQTTVPGRSGDFRKVQVRVNQPGVEVRARNGYFPPAAPKASKKKPPPPIDAAVSGALPSTDLPVTVHAIPVASADGRGGEIAVVAGVVDSSSGEQTARPGTPWPTREVRILAVAFDDGWTAKASSSKTVAFRVQPVEHRGTVERYYEVLTRLPIKPGRYEVRVALDVAGRVGSAYTSIDVPDFGAEDLTLSTVAVSRTPAIAALPADALAGLLPTLPTASRTFARTDRVEAFVRLSQRRNRPASSVSVTATLTSEADRQVFTRTTDLAADAFGRTAQADHHLVIPLEGLTPGQYLLTLTAVMSPQAVATRTLRFTIR